jgi:hypothetical protein
VYHYFTIAIKKQTDGRSNVNGQTDGRTDKQTDRQTDTQPDDRQTDKIEILRNK